MRGLFQNEPARGRWVQRARAYVNTNRNDQALQARVAALEFLLDGHVGIDSRVAMRDVINHVNQVTNLGLSREEFQNQVLTDLKRASTLATLVYPGPVGGVFIPENDEEVERAARQVIRRISQELYNVEQVLDGLAGGNRLLRRVRQLRRDIDADQELHE